MNFEQDQDPQAAQLATESEQYREPEQQQIKQSSQSQSQLHYHHSIPCTCNTSNLSLQEQHNLDVVCEYMIIAYDPKRASSNAVKHLCANDNTFIAPSTFPTIHTCEDYAEDHGKLMKSLNDLHFLSFDTLFVQENYVCIRYTATGTHQGEPHGDIQPTGKKATWTAVGIFRLNSEGKIIEFIKEWNKPQMWEQLGWPIEECLTYDKKQDEKEIGEKCFDIRASKSNRLGWLLTGVVHTCTVLLLAFLLRSFL